MRIPRVPHGLFIASGTVDQMFTCIIYKPRQQASLAVTGAKYFFVLFLFLFCFSSPNEVPCEFKNITGSRVESLP